MASPFLSNRESDSYQSWEPGRKRRRKIEAGVNDGIEGRKRWRTQSEQSFYSAKLFEALRLVRRNSAASASSRLRARAVKDAADRALAVASRGRTRWSRAILATQLSLKLKHRHRKAIVKVAGGGDLKRKARIRERGRERALLMKKEKEARKDNRSLPESINTRLRALGRLVPGCRKLSFSNLVEETADYIAALEMQARTMAALAELLSGAGARAGRRPSSPDRLGSAS